MAVLKANHLEEGREPARRTICNHSVLIPIGLAIAVKEVLKSFVLCSSTKLLQQVYHGMIVPQILATAFVHAYSDINIFRT